MGLLFSFCCCPGPSRSLHAALSLFCNLPLSHASHAPDAPDAPHAPHAQASENFKVELKQMRQSFRFNSYYEVRLGLGLRF